MPPQAPPFAHDNHSTVPQVNAGSAPTTRWLDEWPGFWLENRPASFVREYGVHDASQGTTWQLLARARAHGLLLNSSPSWSTPSLISSPCLPADTHAHSHTETHGMSRSIAGYGPPDCPHVCTVQWQTVHRAIRRVPGGPLFPARLAAPIFRLVAVACVRHLRLQAVALVGICSPC
ncbi:hypothetical protein CCMA1212_006120 [Trichoderma ghanense]|uniref:Uncharacterized protein n=1 Tax=Trichoderma ghanense TaxID=65468 RepID=A0ABY2H1R6_9HYPO